VNRIAPDAERFLETADWPGNVRELKNLIERAMLLKKDSVLCLEDFFHPSGSPLRPTGEPLFTLHLAPQEGKNLLQESQKQLVQQALEIAGQNRTRAAQLLGIPRTSLNFYIQKFGIRSGKNQPA
jgi:DNA-binding NtrC family response regulator